MQTVSEYTQRRDRCAHLLGRWLPALALLLACGGCHWLDHVPLPEPPCLGPGCSPAAGIPISPVDAAGPNPIFVPVAHHDAAWEAIVDVIDDYFRIATEQRVKIHNGVVTEGRIETYPTSAATLLEPHRPDSVGVFNRLHATLQTVRKQAAVRVVPTAGGYRIEAIVDAQLEDLPHPEHSTAGAANLRNDQTIRPDDLLLTQNGELVGSWYSLGRDVALEQQILAEIRMALDVTPPGVLP